MNYCRIFTELAESFLETMVTGSTGGKQHYSIKILDLVLACVGHHDYEVQTRLKENDKNILDFKSIVVVVVVFVV